MSDEHAGTEEATAELTLGSAGNAPERPVRVRSRGAELRPIPTAIGRFEVVRRLGEGGMGVVVEARDPSLDRLVAIKLVRVSDDTARDRLLREARAMARVTHPNVVSVYEAGLFESEVFIVMELVEGATTLADWLAASPRTWREAGEMIVGAGLGLAAAHDVGIVHRDFKLDNVMVGPDGRPRLADFGIARSAAADVGTPSSTPDGGSAAAANLTHGMLVGTPAYMSPEQFSGGDVGAASDQFSFAVAAYRALWGAAPFEGDDAIALMKTVCSGALRPPPATPEVPPAIRAAVLRGLATRPEDRWPCVADLVEVVRGELHRDPDADLSRGRLVRIALAAVVVLLSVNRVRIAVVDGPESIDADTLRTQMTIAAIAVGVLTIAFRRVLLTTSYNRRVVALFVAAVLGMAAHRVLGERVNASVQAMLLGDSVLLAALIGFGAVSIDRRLGFCAAFAVASAVACSRSHAAAVYALPILTGVCSAVLIALWQRPATVTNPGASTTERSTRRSAGVERPAAGAKALAPARMIEVAPPPAPLRRVSARGQRAARRPTLPAPARIDRGPLGGGASGSAPMGLKLHATQTTARRGQRAPAWTSQIEASDRTWLGENALHIDVTPLDDAAAAHDTAIAHDINRTPADRFARVIALGRGYAIRLRRPNGTLAATG